MAKWELDKGMCWLQAGEAEVRATKQAKQSSEDLFHIWDVARLNGVSYDPGSAQQDQRLMSLVQGCQTRPSQDPHLVDQGVLQYWYSKTFETVSTESMSKHIKVTATSRVDDKETWNSTNDAMVVDLCFGQSTKRRKPDKLSGALASGENPSKDASSHLPPEAPPTRRPSMVWPPRPVLSGRSLRIMHWLS